MYYFEFMPLSPSFLVPRLPATNYASLTMSLPPLPPPPLPSISLYILSRSSKVPRVPPELPVSHMLSSGSLRVTSSLQSSHRPRAHYTLLLTPV